VDTLDEASSWKETLTEQGLRYVQSLHAVKQGRATQRDLAGVSKMLKNQVGAAVANAGCGFCLHCLRDRATLEGGRTRLLVSTEMSTPQGKKGCTPMKDALALRPDDKECITIQALRAWAGGKPGLVWSVGEETYVWHKESNGKPHGEWFKGAIRSYDPLWHILYSLPVDTQN
jgi:hypothetical protein